MVAQLCGCACHTAVCLAVVERALFIIYTYNGDRKWGGGRNSPKIHFRFLPILSHVVSGCETARLQREKGCLGVESLCSAATFSHQICAELGVPYCPRVTVGPWAGRGGEAWPGSRGARGLP